MMTFAPMMLLADIATDATESGVADPAAPGSWWAIPRQIPHQGDLISWCQALSPGAAALLVMMGIIYLMFGFQIFKGLILLNAAIVGGYLGSAVGHGETAIVGSVVGAIAAAAITWPTMKYAVALMGGIFGAVLGAGLWRTCNIDPHLVWAGAAIGLVALGMLAFVLFRGSVMMYTSLQGAFMLVFGGLGLMLKYKNVAGHICDHMKAEHFLLPALIFIPAIVGLIYQHHQLATAGGGKSKG